MIAHVWNEDAAAFKNDRAALEELRRAYGNGPFDLSAVDADGFVIGRSTVGNAWARRPFTAPRELFTVHAPSRHDLAIAEHRATWTTTTDPARLISIAAELVLPLPTDTASLTAARTALRNAVLGACCEMAQRAGKKYDSLHTVVTILGRLVDGPPAATLADARAAYARTPNGGTPHREAAREAISYALHAHYCEPGFFSGVASDTASYAGQCCDPALLEKDIRGQISWELLEAVLSGGSADATELLEADGLPVSPSRRGHEMSGPPSEGELLQAAE